MEKTALSVGKSVLDGALGYAKSAIAEKVALQLGIQQDHAFVTDELDMMRSFMLVAHEEQDDNKVVKTWVKQVRDTACDVEDSLQDFAVHLKKPSRWHPLRTLLERRRVAKQMKELRAKVEDVSQRSKRYRLINGSGSKAATASEQSSSISAAISSINDARRSARRDNQRVDLVQLICKEDEDPKMIAVCGTSGDIGQTSVIRAAYENPHVQNKFPVRACEGYASIQSQNIYPQLGKPVPCRQRSGTSAGDGDECKSPRPSSGIQWICQGEEVSSCAQ
jgi:hypothetical protein